MYENVWRTDQERKRFQKIYKENRELLYVAAWKILQGEVAAENAVYTCFVKLALHFKEYSRFSDDELQRVCVVFVKNSVDNTQGDSGKKDFLYLRHVLGLSAKEIADLFDKSVSEVEEILAVNGNSKYE